MRGTADAALCLLNAVGITPACAGNSKTLTLLERSTKDHPRVCGEQPAGDQRAVPILGSPPRVRGTGRSALESQRFLGITPACAGNSRNLPWPMLHHEDHPRVCGEQNYGQEHGFLSAGSPPRVRGTADVSLCQTRLDGITPACAGNRKILGTYATLNEDHPRVCGEQPPSPRRPSG